MCGCDFAEPARVYRTRLVRVRKEHRCYDCSRTIRVGELAEVTTAMWEPGDWNYFHTCRMCRAIREAWHDVEGCWAPHGNVRDEVGECLRDLRRVPLSERDDDHVPEAFVRAPESIEFGIRLRVHLGKYGPQQQRGAA